MKRLLILLTFAALGLAYWQYPSWKVAQQQLAIAEERVDAMIEEGINHVAFDDLPELRRLPSNISKADRLVYLNIAKTNVYDLSGIEGTNMGRPAAMSHTATLPACCNCTAARQPCCLVRLANSRRPGRKLSDEIAT